MAQEAVNSEIAGRVWKILAREGSRVGEEEEVMILESMKMEVPVLAPSDGTIREVLVAEGDEVVEGQTLAVLEN